MTNHPSVSNLTQGQQLMWLGQSLHPQLPLYNMINTFTINGAVDSEVFARAFNMLVSASENLRTTIQLIDDAPQAIILDSIDTPLEMVDLSSRTNPEVAFERWLDSRRAQALQMDTCLFDSVLLNLNDKRYVWYFCQHHIVTDVTSTHLIYQQMSDLYAQAISEQSINAPELPSYEQRATLESELAQTEAYQQAQDYWQNELEKPTEPLRFYSHLAKQSSARTNRQELPLSTEMMQQLETVANERGIRSFSKDLTIANIFSTLILAFVQRITQQDNLRLGMPFASRRTPDEQKTLGMFIEVLSIYVELAPDETFRSLVKKVAAKNMEALRNTQAGISSAEHNRAYEVLLNYITVAYGDFAGIPIEHKWVHSGYGDSKHQIRFQVHDMDDTGHLEIDFDFSADTFTANEQKLAVEHFQRLMSACLADIDKPLNQISLLSETEYKQNIVDFNTTDTDYLRQKTVIDLFEEQCKKIPSAIAITEGDTEITYAELNASANHLAQKLLENGVNAGSLVPVCISHSPELLVTLLAILKVGAAYVPLDPNYPNERLRFILDDIGADALVLVQSQHAQRFDNQQKLVINANILKQTADTFASQASVADTAYVIYTSGSTGQPKGVLVHHAGLTNYITWASKQYVDETSKVFALYSSLAFDLTVTSIFVPLISGGTIRIYNNDTAQGMVIRDVFVEDAVDVIKLTPSHLALMRDMDLSQTRIKKLIVGGEDFKTDLAQDIHRQSNGRIAIYNEYGPTEATVACMLHRYQPQNDIRKSVPIGTPADNMRVYILDDNLQLSPIGVIGEMFISGLGVAKGYLNRPELTAERFLNDPFNSARRLYKTGDIARWLPSGQLEFLGRRDAQVKVGGARIELGEIESKLIQHPQINAVAVIVQKAEDNTALAEDTQINYCVRCGLASDFPGVTFNHDNVCSVCSTYDSYSDKAQEYFKDMDELRAIAEQMKAKATGDYDCIALLSGGKDSTFMVYHLVNLGLRVLTFTLDNGYISNEAMANVRRITDALGVDHVFGDTPFMNSIFVDSLKTHTNVCNGCFKTIYTLAINIAREKGIPTIVTGLSRGQFFETRLSEEVFLGDNFDASKLDESIARARKAYHQRDDIISRSLDVDVFRDEALYQDIDFVDFYRYCDIDLEDLYDFLKEKGLWVRPSDTGRSTNCLINDVGIYLHKKQRGFHNYALPYSWDVRLGHKTRDEALDELNDEIDEKSVQRIMREIGYTEPIADEGQDRLVAYYVASEQLTSTELREFVGDSLPDYMIPSYFVRLDAMPLTSNGKVNQSALPSVHQDRDTVASAYIAPTSDVEETLVDIWQTVLNLPRIGVQDNFFDLGGHSLPAIRITSRIENTYDMTLPIDVFFANPTVAQLAIAIEDILLSEIDNLSNEEVLRLLAEDDE